MSIGGGIKVFNTSQNLVQDGNSATATSGNSAANYGIDRNPDTYWRTVGSTDAATETYTISLSGSKTITRILLLDINWKNFDVMYDVGGTWTDFTSVVGMDGSKASVAETAFADNSAYYEVASVSTTAIRIRVTSTQIANAQKYLAQAIFTTELGTLVGYPEISALENDRNARVHQTISGRCLVQKSTETMGILLNFKNYPHASAYNADVDLMMTLFDMETPFLVWLCGGRRGTTRFGYTLRGFRLKDCYQMQITKAFKMKYSDNIYKNGLNMQIQLEEHV